MANWRIVLLRFRHHLVSWDKPCSDERELTMNNTLQYRGGQEASNRMQPCAALRASARTQSPLPAYEHPTPAQLPAAAVTLLASYGAVKVYPKNTVLTYEGDPSTACFVVLSGRIRVYASTASGKELTLTMPAQGNLWRSGAHRRGPARGDRRDAHALHLVVVPRTASTRVLPNIRTRAAIPSPRRAADRPSHQPGEKSGLHRRL